MKHLYGLSIAALILAAVGCDDSGSSELDDGFSSGCQAGVDIWKCDTNILYKCVSGTWQPAQVCEANTQCSTDYGGCVPYNTSTCTENTWKCDGNILSICVFGTWQPTQVCEANTQCNAVYGVCIPYNTPTCTENTWKCDGNLLSKCVSGTWQSAQACDANTQCNASIGACTQTDTPTTECKNTEHFFAGKCEADDVTHCGTHTNDCTMMAGWKTGTCYGKKCFAETCQTGYHLNSIFDSNNGERTLCEEDTHDACGSINRQCGPKEICTQGKCQDSCLPGEVVCDGSCINPNTSKDFCGADASCNSYIPCSALENCINGRCVQSSCPNTSESLCTVNGQKICVNIHGNNLNHCGACGAVCSDKDTAKASGCNQGKCTYTCNQSMVNCGSSTEPMCLSSEQLKSDPLHCGNCNTQCKDNELCQNGKCIPSSCTGNTCLYNNSCINQNEHCGSQCINCNTANHAKSGICQSGTCKITSCAAGYHLTNKGNCELDSATACPNGMATGTVNCNTIDPYTKSGNCTNGYCVATECQSNAHLKNGACIADTTTNCGASETNCTSLAGWKTGTCENGKCVASTCKSGYCLNTLQGLCTNAQSSTTCGTNGGACQSCSQKQVCSAGSCVDKQCEGNICNQTQASDETLICKNDNTHCGSECMNCNTFTNNATAGTCNANGACQVTKCKTGYHTYNNACEQDSLTNCGAHGTKCDKANATNTVCSNGVCQATTCKTNYHIYAGACEADSLTNCGAHGHACTNVQTCSVGDCVLKYRVGDLIIFGNYEQDNDTSNGKEPIKWRVLAIDHNKGQFLIISDKVLDAQPYNTTNNSITWDKSTIRSWLNGYGPSSNKEGIDYRSNNFIDTAFTSEEKAIIIASKVQPYNNPYHPGTSVGNSTTDKIFLLSVVEVENYYFTTNEAREAYATRYAIKNGVYADYYDNDTPIRCTTSHYISNKCLACWWLRSPGGRQNYAAYVNPDGKFYDDFVTTHEGVRPALWFK
ncbi:MAG: hypothetical protein IKY83_04335 [Proteobacteria bacterium]|nr:hypothetical protein [Pseudomonadota bacterium]